MKSLSSTSNLLWRSSLCLLGLMLALACKRAAKDPTEAAPTVPSVRLYVASTVAGAMEPCGCRKDMLGGVDHAAQLIELGKQEAPNSLVVAAGPLFFLNPELASDRRQQDIWKAHGIAAAMADLKLAAWVPGVNDFAAGVDEFNALAKVSQARVLGANLKADAVSPAATSVIDVGGKKVGIAGAAQLSSGRLPEGVSLVDMAPALRAAQKTLRDAGADVLVALVAAPRGEALRLAETVSGFSAMIVGKPLDRGEGNDAPTPPVLVGETLVVQAPNHLQSMAVVDLFVREDGVTFKDGSGIEAQERKESLERRISELETRIEGWKAKGAVKIQDLNAREADLRVLKGQLGQFEKPVAPPSGNFFRYDLRDVRETLGSNQAVYARMRDYYKRVNDHNKTAFKDRKPSPAPKGQATFAGIQSCAECHEEAYAFWKTTGHAKAYETLVVDFKEFNLDCVSCHVTGYERPGGSTVTFVENLKDVQCEECHGAGSIHADTLEASDITLEPSRALCSKCHHPPHVADDWDAGEAWEHIIGPGHGKPLEGDAKKGEEGSGGAKHSGTGGAKG